MSPRREPAGQRLNRHLRQQGDCLVFSGSCDRKGYGRIRIDGRIRPAHRVAYEHAHGPIPAGLVVMHSCDNPPCCRIDHLSIGTVADNNADRDAKGRAVRPPVGSRARQTHCKNQHPFDEANTYRHRGGRGCRACRKEASARAYQRRITHQLPTAVTR